MKARAVASSVRSIFSSGSRKRYQYPQAKACPIVPNWKTPRKNKEDAAKGYHACTLFCGTQTSAQRANKRAVRRASTACENQSRLARLSLLHHESQTLPATLLVGTEAPALILPYEPSSIHTLKQRSESVKSVTNSE